MKRILFIISVFILTFTVPASADEFGNVEFPGGASSFADSVLSFEQGTNVTQGTLYTDPANSLGAPDYVNSDSQYVSLGNGGTLILRFSDNSLTTSGDTEPDLWVFEIGPAVESTEVYISVDGITWINVGVVSGSTSGVDIDYYIGNGVVFGTKYSFVKLIDVYDDDFSSGGTSGADIDAVGAISSSAPVPVEDPPLNGFCNPIALSSFSQLDNRDAAVNISSDGLALPGAAWTNGREDEFGNIDGNGVSSDAAYNHVGAVSYAKFKVNGADRYLAGTVGPVGLPMKFWSTDHSWQGSFVVPDNQWLYSRAAVDENGNWVLALSSGDYDDKGGTLLNKQSGELTRDQMDALEDAPFMVQYADNYGGTATVLTLAEVCITSGESSGDCSQTELDARFEAGKQFCIDNPAACGIETGGDYQAGFDAGLKAGLAACPSSGECTPATINEDREMHIPNLQYLGPFGTTELEATFEFHGGDGGEFLWRLSDYQMH